MKSINIKQTEIKMQTDEGDKLADYTDLIRVALNQPKPGGYDYSDIENRIAVTKALNERENGTIQLEDAYFKFLHDLINSMRWPFWHEDLITFKTDLNNLKN